MATMRLLSGRSLQQTTSVLSSKLYAEDRKRDVCDGGSVKNARKSEVLSALPFTVAAVQGPG